MVHTYFNSNNIYSVDMMFAYINIYKPKKLFEAILIKKYFIPLLMSYQIPKNIIKNTTEY